MALDARIRRAKQVRKILSPVEDFLKLETSGGIILIISTLVAMIWANSPFKESYFDLFHTYIKFSVGDFEIKHSLLHWINDGLMAIFFFLVGLEIKRELVLGELSTPRKATLPMLAALGGMLVPALIYFVLNPEGVGRSGWGIPMATDIAFALGILMLLGPRVPFVLKIFLLALAIVDDLGAVLVIAFFYTEEVYTQYLGMAFGLMALIFIMNQIGVRNVVYYIIMGTLVWFCFLLSGIHATIAGVILGLMTPVTAWIRHIKLDKDILPLADNIKDSLKGFNIDDTPVGIEEELPKDTYHHLERMKFLSTEAISPLDRFVHKLHPWVSYLIVPLFALANAGVDLSGMTLDTIYNNRISLGIILGLLVGKPLGIMGACFIAVKTGLAELPKGITWSQIFATSVLAAIGFTMALFISGLAIKDPDYESYSKLGILAASTIASILGYILLRWSFREKKLDPQAPNV